MTESKKIGFQGVSIFLIATGLILFLFDISHSGSAIEACSFSHSPNTSSIIGGALIILSAALLLIAYFKKK